jgi:hypothetical protein
VVAATLELPPDRLGVTHWSTWLLAAELGISNFAVGAVWKKWGLQPWRVETFKFSTDPDELLPHATGGQTTSITRH